MTKILPKYKIEVSFTASNTTGLSFTDITSDVRLGAGIPITVGRSDQFSDVQASTASFTVDNISTTYTPGAGNVTRGRAVRISATEDNPASYTQIWYGFIDTITQAWDNETGKMSNVLFTCVDLSTLLSRRSLTQTLLGYYATTPSAPVEWWPLDDAVGTASPLNTAGKTRVVNVAQAPGAAQITYQFDGVPYGTGGQHAVQLGEASLNVSATTALYDQGTSWTMMMFFQLPNGAPSGTIDLVSLASDSSFTNFAVIQLLNDGSVGFSISASGGVASSGSTGSHLVDDGKWHHVALAFGNGAGGSCQLWVDGVAVLASTGLGTGSAGMPIVFLAQVITPSTTVNIQHVMVYAPAILTAQITNIALAGLNAFAGETSVARVQRIAAIAGYTPTVSGSGVVKSMAPWHDFGGSFWDMMTTVAKTERGILYIDRNGAIAFRAKDSLFNQTAALSFGSGTYEASLQFVQSASNFLNQFVATAYGSANPQTQKNQTSIDNDGLWNDSATVETSLDTEALSYAQAVVSTTGIPLTRLPQLDVDLMTQQTLFAGLLAGFWALDLGDLITVSSLPSQAVASSVNLLLQGFAHTLTDKGYDATLNLADGQKSAWVLQDATYGVLDSTTILA